MRKLIFIKNQSQKAHDYAEINSVRLLFYRSAASTTPSFRRICSPYFERSVVSRHFVRRANFYEKFFANKRIFINFVLEKNVIVFNVR